MAKPGPGIDIIGRWSQVKLEIVRDYAAAYSRILSAQRHPSFHHVYIDGFAGPGVHIARETGEFVAGSPTNALLVEPPFKEFYFIDLDGDKVKGLHEAFDDRGDVHILKGDCNEVLLKDVLPNVRWDHYQRGLCLLDPYGLHLRWDVTQEIAKAQSVEIFLNFPIMDINQNVLRRDPERIDPVQAHRMTAFWGDESWRDTCYTTEGGLFGWQRKRTNEEVAAAFRQRLLKGAGFGYVPEPMPMRNARRAVVYYLFFAAHKPAAAEIVTDIFQRHADSGGRHGRG